MTTPPRVFADPFTSSSQIDTTPPFTNTSITNTSITSTTSITSIRPATLLSAYHGLNDALPPQINLLCPGGSGLDGLPVVFSHQIDAATLDAGDFAISIIQEGPQDGEEGKTGKGKRYTPRCATLRPAVDDGELRTVLLIGQFGDLPTEVCVIGTIMDACGMTLFQNECVEVVPLQDSPSLAFAEVVSEDVSNDGGGSNGSGGGTDRSAKAAGGTSRCPDEQSARIIRATWNAGITLPNNTPVPARNEAASNYYRVTLSDGTVIQPAMLGDVNDGDNNHLLCFDEESMGSWSDWSDWSDGDGETRGGLVHPISVSIDGGWFTDPREDGTNLRSTVNITTTDPCINADLALDSTILPSNSPTTMYPALAATSGGSQRQGNSILGFGCWWLFLAMAQVLR